MNDSPDLSAPAVESAVTESRAPSRSRFVLLMGLLLLIAALVLAYFQRDQIERQWIAWTGPVESAGPAERGPEPVDPLSLSVDGGNAIDDPAAEAYRERLETQRERLVSDPEAAQQEIERLVATQADGRARSDREQSSNDQGPETDSPSRGQRVSRPAPQRNRTVASTEQMAEIQRRLDEAERRRQLAEADGDSSPPGSDVAQEISEQGKSDETSVDGWTPAASEYVRAWELPLSVRRSLPALTLNIHVFSEELERRFVLINGERYINGDELPDGARLVDIRREGAVVDYRDYRFLLEP